MCGIELISTGIWRRKPQYLTPQTTPSPPSCCLPLYSGGCLYQAACITRFVKDVAASCRFHGRLPTSPHVFCPFLIYSHFSLYPPPPVNLLMNSASWMFFFSAIWSHPSEALFTDKRDRCLCALILSYQGRAGWSAGRSAGSLCLLHHARLQSVNSV